MIAPQCPKCESFKINTTYHKSCPPAEDPKQHTYMASEHLHQFCMNCQFDWTEPVKDG